jgi:hypothetical protein
MLLACVIIMYVPTEISINALTVIAFLSLEISFMALHKKYGLNRLENILFI